MATDKRYYALDNLRAVMLLLGLLLHSCISYFPPPEEGQSRDEWYFYDITSSSLMVPVFAAIHIYRMPIFFVLGGFFAAMLVTKRGVKGMLLNRARRLGCPLLVSILTLIPVLYLASRFALSQSDGSVDDSYELLIFSNHGWNNLHHLWFLWHLLVLYSITAIVFVLLHFSHSQLTDLCRACGLYLMRSAWASVTFVTLSAMLLVLMKIPGFLDTSHEYIPAWHVLCLHGLCYFYGWLLFFNRSYLDGLIEQAVFRFVVGCVATGVSVSLIGMSLYHGKPESMNGVISLISSIAMLLMIEGCLGFFLKYFNTNNAMGRYVSESSYFVYLLHLPAIIFCQGLVANWHVIAEIKWAVSLSMATLICFISYHFLVRNTLIGVFLNGRRFPLSLEKAEN